MKGLSFTKQKYLHKNIQNVVNTHQPKTTRNTTLVEPSWTHWCLLEQGKLYTMGNHGASHEVEIRTHFIGFEIG